ncbi:hypothetical protein M432DRAFT_598520 [Thermoascus aurantiacus ATCC 26904]
MLFAKSTLFLSLLALCHIAVAAIPPACLLSAIGSTQDNPADLKAVCVTNGAKVEAKISSICGDDTQAALKAFSSTCASAGYKVAVPTATKTGSSSTSTDSAIRSGVAKPSGFVTATAPGSLSTGSRSSTGSSSAGSASASPAPFDGAASSNRAGSAAAFAAAVFVGVAAAL